MIDLNADVGEGGSGDAAILRCVTSANIACGGHAGDEVTMRATVRLALANGVAIGAHPGFEDRADFGRTERSVSAAEVADLITRQVETLRAIATQEGARVVHMKPHGALYNQSARDETLARAIAEAVKAIDPRLRLVGLASSVSIRAAEQSGLAAVNEAFADRRYLANGSLVPRIRGSEAIITDEDEAVRQVLQLVRDGIITASTGQRIPIHADTICLHGDSPPAVQLARRLRHALSALLVGGTGGPHRFSDDETGGDHRFHQNRPASS